MAATVRRWTPYSRARSSSERPCWYSAAMAATSEGDSRRWTGLIGRLASSPAVGESMPSTSARSALEPGFECCPLLSGPPTPGRFEERLAAFCGFGPAAGSTKNPCRKGLKAVPKGSDRSAYGALPKSQRFRRSRAISRVRSLKSVRDFLYRHGRWRGTPDRCRCRA